MAEVREETRRESSLRKVAGKLTGVNLAITLAAVVTSPLTARALGPAGRGDLAAITVVGTLLGSLGDFGLQAFVVRESALGTPVRKLVGSIGPPIVLLGICWAAAGPAVARLIAGDRSTVYSLLLACLLLMPLVMFTSVTSAILWGQQRWRLFTVQRLAVPLGSVIVYGVLFLTGDLTVETAGITFIILGTFVSAIPGLLVLRHAGRPQWSLNMARRGCSYGMRIWLAAIFNQTNARLDQLLMTRLVLPAQLGLYVVAVNVSLIQVGFTAAIATALLPRVAMGETHLTTRALRVVLMLTAIASVSVIVTVPVLLPLVFGSDFSGAVVMCQILAVAAVPFGLSQVMANILAGLGEPGIPARAELISVVITVPALLIFVHRYAGVGAAVITLVAYTVTVAYMAFKLRQHQNLSYRSMFLVRRSDLALLRTLPVINRLFG